MSKHRLLLADDSVTIQKVVNLTFADEGIEVIAVGDGDTAMQKFVEFVPDLVMVDVNMPGADGYQICEMIKQDEETRHIPVILLVGSFEPFDEEEARRVGADDFLTKPFQSIRQLVNKVSDLLDDKANGNLVNEPVNSFNDTLEMDAPAEAAATEKFDDSTAGDFGDAAMDDDLIQTNQIGNSADEPAKIESASSYQPLEDTTEDDGEIEFVSAADEPPPRHENIYEFANEQESADEESYTKEFEISGTQAAFAEEPEREETVEEFTREEASRENSVEETTADEIDRNESPLTTEAFSALSLDDFDLLELPHNKKFEENEQIETPSSEPEAFEAAPSFAGNLSPEAIEAVANRVIEKISDEVIEKIVREVISQITRKK